MNTHLSVNGVRILVLIALVIGAPFAAAASSGHNLLASIDQAVLDQVGNNGQATFWVVMKEQVDLSPAYKIPDWEARGKYVYNQLNAVANHSQARVRATLQGANADYKPYWIFNAVLVTGDRTTIEQIASLPEVDKIALSTKIELPPEQPAQEQPRVNYVEWNIDRINAPMVWDTFGVRGDGIVVANIDTGVQYDHPALMSQYRGNQGGGFDHNYNWYDPTGICGSTPCDNVGHGTHTMGTMVGDDGGDNQIGVAPAARWIATKGCEYDWCSDYNLLSAGQWVLAPWDQNGANPDPAQRPHIVNNSWGGGQGNAWYQAMVQAWVASGIFPAFSNGNSGSGCWSANSPGDYPESYAAGAFDYYNTIAWFSSRGPSYFGGYKPNIAAPGVDVKSSYPTNSYAWYSGTSMASPHVAGTVALMWSAAPSLIGDISATRSLLDQSAINTSDWQCDGGYPPPGGGEIDPNNVYGEGRLDAYAAVEQSPRGPVGSLQGTVIDESTLLPVADALVAINGPTNRERYTDENGFYQWSYLDVGVYGMQVSKFGYLKNYIDGVEIVEGATTVEDVMLSPAPSYEIDGYVRDDQGQPIANAAVTFLNTPLPPAITDSNGYYIFWSVPEGSYDIEAMATGCYLPESKNIYLNNSREINFTLPVKYDAYGYHCQEIPLDWHDAANDLSLYYDDTVQVSLPFAFPFYGETYQTAWVSANGLFNFLGWNYNSWNESIPTPNSPNAAIYPFWDDLYVEYWYGDRVQTETLGSPPNRIWVLEYQYVRFSSDYWTQIRFESKLFEKDGSIEFHYLEMPGYYGDGKSATVGIENADGYDGLQYSYNQSAVASGKAIRFIPPPQGAIQGTVTDANDGLPIENATVQLLQDGSVVAQLNTDENGFYYIIRKLGTYTVEVSAPNYAVEQVQVSLETDGQVVTQDFALKTPRAEVSPIYLSFVVPPNQTRTKILTLNNTGSLDMPWELHESGGGAISTATSQGLTLNPDFDPNARTTMGRFLNGQSTGWSPTWPGEVIRKWRPTGVNFAWGVGYREQVWLSDVSTSWGDYCAYYGVCTNNEFTPYGEATGVEWTAPWASLWPADMAYDYNRDLMCQVNVGGDNGIYCWDPDTGDIVDKITGSFPWTWTSQRGLAYRPDDDTFYIGGWNSGVLYHIKGLSYPDKGAVINQCYPPDYAISGLAWNPAFQIIWEATNSYNDTIYELNPNTCEVIATLPHPSPYYAGAGLEMDETGNLWMIDQSPNEVYLIESGVPAFIDVPWISEEPLTGRLAPGASQSIQVTVDTTGMEPGIYNATLFIQTSSAKNPMLRVPVNLIVPAYMTLVNTGGKQYIDLDGDMWSADQMYRMGGWGYVNKSQTVSTSKPIAGTLEDKLYQDLRQGILEYRFDGLPAGIYQIELHFAEIKPTQPNARLYDVLIEGNIVIYAHDTALEVGSLAADVHTFFIEVTDGQLNIRFIPRRGYQAPIINAIAVIERPDR